MTRDDHDERFEVTEISRRGAHRARPNPLTGLLPILALVVVVIGVLGLAYLFFGRGGTSTSTAPGTGAVGSSVVSSASVAASAPRPSAASSPAASTGQEGTGQQASAAPVDKTITLNLYNGSSPNVPRLSRKASVKLAADGWRIGTVLPWTGAPVARTTVYYASPEQLPAARAVVKVLGAGTVKLNKIRAAQGLAVVVSNDYTP